MDDHQDERDLSTIEIGPYQPGDEVEILKTFNEVFSTDRSLEIWNWEYANNPEGVHVFLARFPDGEVVSQFAGIPRRVKVKDETRCFSEIVDSMTAAKYRQGLKKPGWFASTCNAFVEHYGRPDRESIMYGFPVPPAFRVGRALLGYTLLYKVEFLRGEVDGAGTPSAEFVDISRFDEKSDALYERFARDHEVLTVRDARYMNWRFIDRPDVNYEIFGRRRDSDGELEGIAVLRHEWTDQPISMLCELMVPDAAVEKEFLAEAEARAKAAGAGELRSFFRPDSRSFTALRDAGYELERTQWRFVARTYDFEGIPLEWLKDAWYVSLGDFDLV